MFPANINRKRSTKSEGNQHLPVEDAHQQKVDDQQNRQEVRKVPKEKNRGKRRKGNKHSVINYAVLVMDTTRVLMLLYMYRFNT